jgi:hypothetical protein
MPKTKAQVEIGYRAFEEVLRIFKKIKDAENMLGMKSHKLVYDWMEGVAPSAKYLQRLHYCGADVIYILTGVRKNELPKM